jgi:hypothetical protein
MAASDMLSILFRFLARTEGRAVDRCGLARNRTLDIGYSIDVRPYGLPSRRIAIGKSIALEYMRLVNGVSPIDLGSWRRLC